MDKPWSGCEWLEWNAGFWMNMPQSWSEQRDPSHLTVIAGMMQVLTIEIGADCVTPQADAEKSKLEEVLSCRARYHEDAE